MSNSSIHTLHILNKTPDHPRFNECLAMAGPDDAVVLTESGVTGARSANQINVKTVFAIRPDLQARGLPTEISQVHVLDYGELVDLTIQAKRVISW